MYYDCVASYPQCVALIERCGWHCRHRPFPVWLHSTILTLLLQMEVKKTGPPSPHQQNIRHSLVNLSRMTSLVLVLVVTSYTAVADFITSSARLQQLPFLEEQLLSRLRVYEQALPASQREKRQSLQR